MSCGLAAAASTGTIPKSRMAIPIARKWTVRTEKDRMMDWGSRISSSLEACRLGGKISAVHQDTGRSANTPRFGYAYFRPLTRTPNSRKTSKQQFFCDVQNGRSFESLKLGICRMRSVNLFLFRDAVWVDNEWARFCETEPTSHLSSTVIPSGRNPKKLSASVRLNPELKS